MVVYEIRVRPIDSNQEPLDDVPRVIRFTVRDGEGASLHTLRETIEAQVWDLIPAGHVATVGFFEHVLANELQPPNRRFIWDDNQLQDYLQHHLECEIIVFDTPTIQMRRNILVTDHLATLQQFGVADLNEINGHLIRLIENHILRVQVDGDQDEGQGQNSPGNDRGGDLLRLLKHLQIKNY